MTIDELIKSAEHELKAATEQRDYAKEQIKSILDAARKQNRNNLSDSEEKLVNRLFDDVETHNNARSAAQQKLEAAQQAKREDDEYMRQTQDVRPGATPPGRNGETPAQGELRSNAFFGASTQDDATTWHRGDGRIATVARNERFGDSEIAREQIDRDPGKHLTETQSGIGQLVRNLSTTGASAIVPQLWGSSIIDRARNASQVLNAGAQIVPMDSKQLNLGRLITDPTTAWLAEGGTRAESDPAFDSVTLVAKTLTCLTVGSLEMLQDSINADAVVEEAIGKAMGLAIDFAALYGGVTSGGEGINQPSPPSPLGILANLLANASSSVLGSGANGTNITAATPFNELLDTYFTPLSFNEQPNAILMNTKMQQKYSKTYDTLGQPLRRPPVLDNIPILLTNQIPSFTQGTLTTATDVFTGNYAQVLWGQRLDITVQVLTERYAEVGSVGLLATFRGDIALARPRAMCVYRYLQGA
jgi:HK97 family phage major capsid protein